MDTYNQTRFVFKFDAPKVYNLGDAHQEIHVVVKHSGPENVYLLFIKTPIERDVFSDQPPTDDVCFSMVSPFKITSSLWHYRCVVSDDRYEFIFDTKKMSLKIEKNDNEEIVLNPME